jgi:hypothetical protein
MENKKRLIEIPEDGIVRIPIMAGEATVGEKRIDLSHIPTVDAVKVVRCGNCHYWDKSTVNKKGFLICPTSGMDITPNDFCSYGERKDNE